jgi:hypothetical protein
MKQRRKPIHTPTHMPTHMKVRKPMPAKPPKVEVPRTVYRRRPKHARSAEAE